MAEPFIVRGEKRGRPGKWIVDYYYKPGKRTWKTFNTEEQAKAFRLQVLTAMSHLQGDAGADFTITFADYAERRWLPQIKATVKKPRTYESYADTVRVHLKPVLGKIRIRHLTRGRIKAFLAAKLSAGLARNTVRIIYATCGRCSMPPWTMS